MIRLHEHRAEDAWLTRRLRSQWVMIAFPDGCAIAAALAPALYEQVLALRPVAHCGTWTPADDPTKYHGRLCSMSRVERSLALRAPASVRN